MRFLEHTRVSTIRHTLVGVLDSYTHSCAYSNALAPCDILIEEHVEHVANCCMKALRREALEGAIPRWEPLLTAFYEYSMNTYNSRVYV